MTRYASRASTMMAGGALRRSTGFVALVFLLGGLLPRAAPAQPVRSSVVLGGVRVRYADALDLEALTLSPSMSVQSGALLLGANGTYSHPTLGDWSAQGMLSGSWFRPLAAPFALELGANVGGSTVADDTRTGNTQALGRVHAAGARAGAWVGAGAGTAWNGAQWQGTRVSEFGAWVQGNAVGLVATVLPTVANDSVRYTDAQLALRWRGARTELDATLGQRSGSARATGVVDPSAWASVSASLRVSPRTALVLSGGSYPLDLLQGFPAGRFVSLGLRLTGPGSGASPEFARGTDELERDRLLRSGVDAVRVRPVGARRYEVRVRASGARVLEVTGDLTGWEPVRMRAEPDGWWSATLEGGPGTYEFTVRRDGGAWVVPAGMPERRDEFGGVSGLITLR